MCSAVRLTAHADSVIRDEARFSSRTRLETGGILLGHDSNGVIRVTVAGAPGPKALHSARRFLRDLDFARELANEAYERDGSVWIGEWHTHPSGPRNPSAFDLRTYTRHLNDPSLGFGRFLSIIVVTSSLERAEEDSVSAWIVGPGGMAGADLEIEEGSLS